MEPREIATGVYCLPVRGANVYLVRSGSSWVLIDAGWRNCGQTIRVAAEKLFGPARPVAILLTHAHPDHQGSAAELARLWGLPVYVHAADLPLLLGELPNEGLDPIGRVLVAVMRLLPQRLRERMSSTEFGDIARALPESDAEVPGLPDWQYVPTPGHSPGHVVFFRPSDRVAIAGDAVLTTPLWGLVRGWQRVSRPPRVASASWRGTKQSIATLVGLDPRVLASGHGIPMTGPAMARELRALADRVSHAATG